ncbi:MAG TPA: hypothetical protein EYP57_08520 [Thermodesulfobacteriaceae bacterium]|nr:hypothetical protein [Thermodesulfobacteriaceae bacterium]
MTRFDNLAKDWILKLLSLGFALFLWFFVVGEEKAELTISVPVEIVNVPSGLVIANYIPRAVDVRVYGPRSMVRSLDSTQRISKVINLHDARAGTITVPMTPDSFSLPGGVRAIRIQPARIEVVLENLVRKAIMVSPNLIGKVARDYEVLEAAVDPPRVDVSGPESEIRSLEKLDTLPVDINGASNTVVREIGLDLEGLHLRPQKHDTVRVTVRVAPVTGRKSITKVPVQLEANATGVSWWPKSVKVTVEGPMPRLRKLKASDITVVIAAQKLKAGKNSVKPEFEIPDGFRILRVRPEKIKVSVPKAVSEVD